MITLFIIYLGAACGLWCIFYVLAARSLRAIRPLPILQQPDPAQHASFPALSLIIAARNEAHTLPAALETLIQQSYSNLEILLINDRSTDNTGEIIDSFAQRDERIRCIHIKKLPDEWLGKPHALHVASQQARGEWLLFSDADVHHSVNLWYSAIQHAEQYQLDHLALLPTVTSRGMLIQATIKAFSMLFLASARTDKIRDPNSPASIGIGAFNLVRRNTFLNTDGFEWLRMEVADDYGLGLMIKRAGGNCDLATANQDLHVEWYESVGAMARGLEKNIMAPGTHFKTGKLILNPIMLTGVVLAPFISLLLWPSWLTGFGVITLLFCAAVAQLIAVGFDEQKRDWLLSPFGFLIIAWIFSRACILCLWRDGIVWRDTHYPRRLLQMYQRVKL